MSRADITKKEVVMAFDLPEYLNDKTLKIVGKRLNRTLLRVPIDIHHTYTAGYYDLIPN